MTATDRPRLLDLDCGAGGAAVGYSRAGFEVVGVDIVKQPRYPFTFVQGDALEYVRRHGREFDAIHASPPCQRFTCCINGKTGRLDHPDQITPLRPILVELDRPYIMENTPGAPLLHPLMLCGKSFNLRVLRHRLFECSFIVVGPPHREHQDFLPFIHKGERAYADAMGCEWMTNREARQSFPPVYTEYLGQQLIHSL